MPDYPYEGQLIADPVTFQRATNAQVFVYDAADTTNSTPLALKDASGLPTTNPLTSSGDAFVKPIYAPSQDIKYVGAGLTVFVSSAKGMRDAAAASAAAAEAAASSAAAEAAAGVASVVAAAASSKSAAEAAAASAAVSAALVNAPSDSAIAAAINGSGTATKAALSATIDTQVAASPVVTAKADTTAVTASIATATKRRPESDLYEPTRGSLRKWRSIRGAVLAGERQGRISCLGDSITFGADTTGNSNPKYNTSWPGRLRSRLNTAYGKGGTGLVIANPDILATPTLDNRFTITGAVTTGATGAFRDGAMTLPVGTAVEFTAECDGFTVYTLSGGGGHVSIKVDGVDKGLIRNSTSTSGATIPATYTGRNVVAPVTAGALGTHTIKIEPTSATVTLIGVEGTIAGAGRFSVSTTAISGKSLSAGGFINTNNDETNAQHGRPILIDLPRADMHVLALGINDVQTGIPTADIKQGMTTAVQRVRMSGTNTQGVPYANGDALIVITPGFQTGAQNYTDYKDALYQVADEQNAALLDLSNRWGPWADANALGMFADTIHPTDRGADDIAAAVHWALFNR